MTKLNGFVAVVLAWWMWLAGQAVGQSFDVVVYGASAGGVAASVQAARMGHSVVLIEASEHIGGLTTGGLGATDFGNRTILGGIAREFYGEVYKHYKDPAAWVSETREAYLPRHKDAIDEKRQLQFFFEPKVAQRLVDGMLAAAKVEVIKGDGLATGGVLKTGARITGVRLQSGRQITARVFIDASYEGDLMAGAGVRYVVGRESNATYGETLNGVLPLEPEKAGYVDPYVKAGDPTSGTLPGVLPRQPTATGEGDGRSQAYNFRLCLTDDEANRVPFAKPDGYDRMKYELLARHLTARPQEFLGKSIIKLTPMPNRKTDSNNHGNFSTDHVGFNTGYAEGSEAERRAIWDEHVTFSKGFLYFLANDPVVPEPIRKEMSRWGFAKDEFVENGGFPTQLYVREGRRMLGRYVMTELDAMAERTADDSIALATYPVDSHQVSRFVDENGLLRLEGAFWKKLARPMPISYRAITPKKDECDNLLVPVCLSSSHVAYGTIRMEPVFMTVGQAAAMAASAAIKQDVAVQDVDYASLAARLKAAGVVVTPPPAK